MSSTKIYRFIICNGNQAEKEGMTMDVTYSWSAKNGKNFNTKTHVIATNRHFHATWNLFAFGYRRFGICYYKISKSLAFYFGIGCISISFRNLK